MVAKKLAHNRFYAGFSDVSLGEWGRYPKISEFRLINGI